MRVFTESSVGGERTFPIVTDRVPQHDSKSIAVALDLCSWGFGAGVPESICERHHSTPEPPTCYVSILSESRRDDANLDLQEAWRPP